jgi:MerR family transcriptional regulator, copper efflux regulator
VLFEILFPMLIAELSTKTGLSKDTIRFYKKIGLITASDRQAGTRSYKEYSPEIVERLLMIHQGKGLGFTLAEIKQLIDEWGSESISKREQVRVIEQKISEIAEKMQKLDEIKFYLTNKLSKLQEEVNATCSNDDLESPSDR